MRDARSQHYVLFVRGGITLDSSIRDSVAAVFREDQITDALSLVHRLGHGHHARVIRNTGNGFESRLTRCGLSAPFREFVSSREQPVVVLLIDAPHQTAVVTDLLLGLGASRVERFQAPSVSSAVLAFDTARLGERRSRRTSSGRHSR